MRQQLAELRRPEEPWREAFFDTYERKNDVIRRRVRRAAGPIASIPIVLANLRIDRGLTQEDAARLAGMGVKKYATFEHSPKRAAAIRLRDLLAILAVYDVTADEFFLLLSEDRRIPITKEEMR